MESLYTTAATHLRRTAVLLLAVVLGACAPALEGPTDSVYDAVTDGDITIPPVEKRFVQEPNRRVSVSYSGPEASGTIVVDPFAKFLFFVEGDGTAIRYPIAVGREGRGFRGTATVGRIASWPGWTPTANMLRTEPEVYGPFAQGIPGGRMSPLGARALYLYRGGRDTYFRIHGTNDPETIGNSGSAGCIRLFNQDVIDLAERVSVGAQVIVRTYEQSLEAEGFELANRGGEMQPKIVDPVAIYAAVEAEQQQREAAAQ